MVHTATNGRGSHRNTPGRRRGLHPRTRGRWRGKKKLTPYQLYEILVGEAGHDSDFILHKARLWQIRSLLRGYYNRNHHAYNAARINAYVTAKCLGSIEDGKTMQDIMPFNWEFVSIAIRKWKEAEEGAALLEQMKKDINTGK